jgi:hypothetical protein
VFSPDAAKGSITAQTIGALRVFEQTQHTINLSKGQLQVTLTAISPGLNGFYIPPDLVSGIEQARVSIFLLALPTSYRLLVLYETNMEQNDRRFCRH